MMKKKLKHNFWSICHLHCVLHLASPPLHHNQFNRILHVNNPFPLICHRQFYTSCSIPIPVECLSLSPCVRECVCLFVCWFVSVWDVCMYFSSVLDVLVLSFLLSRTPLYAAIVTFVTQSYLIRFHHKFLIILVQFISLEFVCLCEFFLRCFLFLYHFHLLLFEVEERKKIKNWYIRLRFRFNFNSLCTGSVPSVAFHINTFTVDGLLSNVCHYYYFSSINILPIFAATPLHARRIRRNELANATKWNSIYVCCVIWIKYNLFFRRIFIYFSALSSLLNSCLLGFC